MPAQPGSPRSRLHMWGGCGSGWDSSVEQAGPALLHQGPTHTLLGWGDWRGVLLTEEAAMEAGREPVPGHLHVSDRFQCF